MVRIWLLSGNHVLRIVNVFAERNNTCFCRDGNAATIDVLNYLPLFFRQFRFFFVAALGLSSCFGKYGLATTTTSCFGAPKLDGALWYDLLQRGTAVSAAVAPVATH